MTLKSWTASQTAIWKKRGKTFITRFVFSPLIFIVHVAWYLAVLLVLLLWCLPDFLPKRRSKPLTSPHQIRRRLPLLYREGSDIFAEMPDGSVIALEPLEAKLYAEACFDVVAGGFVYEKTRIRVDENR